MIDDGALYVSLLLAHDIERIDLTTGVSSFVSVDDIGPWDVQNGLFVTARTVGRGSVESITLRDGSVYWTESDHILRRMILGGGTTQTIAENVSQYTVFEDRVVFISDRNLFYKRLTDAEPTLVLRDVDSFDSVASDGILVTRYSAGAGIYQIHGEVLRVSWAEEVEKIYETDAVTYHNVFSLGGVSAGGTTYVGVVNTYDTRLLAVRNGFAAEIYHALQIGVLAADADALTFLEWGGYGAATGWHHLVRLSCATPPRSRAIR